MDWASCSSCRKTCTPAAVAAVSVRSLVWERAGTGVRAVASTSSKINSNGPFYGVAVRVAVVVSGTAFPPTWTNEFRERRAQEYLGIGGRESAALTSCLSVDLWFLCMHHAPRGAAALNLGLPPTSPFFPSPRAGTGVRAVASTSSKINSNWPFLRRSRESSGIREWNFWR